MGKEIRGMRPSSLAAVVAAATCLAAVLAQDLRIPDGIPRTLEDNDAPVIVVPKDDDYMSEGAAVLKAMGERSGERLHHEIARTADHVDAAEDDFNREEDEHVQNQSNRRIVKEEEELAKESQQVAQREALAEEKVKEADIAPSIQPDDPFDQPPTPHAAVVELEKLLVHARALTADVAPGEQIV